MPLGGSPVSPQTLGWLFCAVNAEAGAWLRAQGKGLLAWRFEAVRWPAEWLAWPVEGETVLLVGVGAGLAGSAARGWGSWCCGCWYCCWSCCWSYCCCCHCGCCCLLATMSLIAGSRARGGMVPMHITVEPAWCRWEKDNCKSSMSRGACGPFALKLMGGYACTRRGVAQSAQVVPPARH